ncbi:MAG TPA: hypothetical protein VN380_09905 [Thermoanaerobaculia bacterium]|jgi:hypothetical protein|nr:hypothetical protein [Thermoanaerobaculia bacterium]
MKELNLDFGLLIAYAIPGALALAGAAHWQKPLRDIFGQAYRGEHEAGSLLALATLSIVAGMIISVVRVSTLDHTFEGAFTFSPKGIAVLSLLATVPVLGVYARRLPKHGLDGSILKGHERIEPDFLVIAVKKRLDVYREAVNSDKRPYQFYGNAIVAILTYVCLVVPTGFGGVFNADRAFRLSVLIISLVPLYTAARTSHNRFMRAVAALNT